jgi:predicted pyridoxine 5'-phosphate oxidase superfamily flavin-nucleotide-binding protein
MRKRLDITEGIFPMPVLMVATYNEDGSVNVMNAAWGTMQARGTVALNLTETHKTVKNIKAKKAFTVKWTKQSAANQKKFNGYEIRYSLKSNMSGAKYAKAAKSSKSKKISKLAKKKKYYVQVRTYTVKNGKTYYSKWSAKKSVKTK